MRICGDYTWLNIYITRGHYPIPNVKKELEKIAGHSLFIDLDLTNAFHQIILGEKTSAMLSVQTPWGQVQPMFLPEGVSPASAILQETVYSLFADFTDFMILIFDNMLILADNVAQGYERLKLVLSRCIERNVFLKMSKSWIGFEEVKFFGYIFNAKGYRLGEDRTRTISGWHLPETTKSMQSFLGAAIFFSPFVKDFSTLAAPLHDMTHKDFDFKKKSTWKQDYQGAFDKFKEALRDSQFLYYPDYSLDWVFASDASLLGVCAILYQLFIDADGKIFKQIIAIISQKFSAQAKLWATIEQECYGIYWGVHALAHMLFGKYFVAQTDHNNLRWMEASLVPKIIRWRVYLSQFHFLVMHIAGRNNKLPDFGSRHFIEESSDLPHLEEGVETNVIR